MNDNEVKFKGSIVRNVFDSPDFKIYGVKVDKEEYPFVKLNKYRNASIMGELPPLTDGVEYDITGIEEQTKYGYSYRVTHIKRDIPTSEHDMYVFLKEILNENQAKVLWHAYPDIVERVVNDNLEDIDLSKMHGIGEKRFESIKKKIIENFKLVDLVAEFNGIITLSMVRKIYEKYSSVETLRYKLATKPYTTLTRINGIGFKKADALILAMQSEGVIDFGYDIKTSQDRCLACVVYALQENEKNEGHTKMNLADLRKLCIDLVPACSNHFESVIENNIIYYNKETMDVSLAATYNVENKIANAIIDNIGTPKNVWEFDVEKYRNVGEFELSDDQMKTLYNVCKNNICILNGFAGSGKSASTQALINMLEGNGKTFKIFAPTGKASKVIAEFTNRPASTIHRGLGYTPPNTWTFNGNNKLDEDLVIIDEFSMVDVWLFARVVDAIDFEKTRLLMIGDNAQLCSVGCGNLLHDFMSVNLIPTVTLTKIFRYADGGLMKAATDIRCGKKYLNSDMKSQATMFGNNKDYMFVDLASDAVPKQAVALYKKLLDSGNSVDNIQVLTAKNVHECGAIELNNMLQIVANKNYGSKARMKVGETTYYVGDLILQKANNYEAELANQDEPMNIFPDEMPKPKTAFVANGETGVILGFDEKNGAAIIDFDGIEVKYYRNDMNMVGLGYAMSIHKSQGSGIDNVIVCTPQSHTFMLNSNLLYVALTRSKKKCYHLGGLNTVNNAIHKKANLERNTFMQDLLIGLNNKKLSQ